MHTTMESSLPCPLPRKIPSPLMGEGVKKSIWFFFTPFRRKPESSLFKPLVIDWTPVFTGGAAVPNFSLREG